MKRIIATVAVLASMSSFAAVTVRYHNGDSKKHTFDALCSGSKYTVSFDASTTSSVTIQGSGPCEVTHGGGKISLSGGENLEIKDGKISKN